MTSHESGKSPETLFLRNRHLLVLSILVSVASGAFALTQLDRFEDARITNLYPIIITAFPGASAERVETLVTEPLEDELAEVDTIRKITSTSLSGVSIINIELLKTVTLTRYRELFAEIRDKVQTASAKFPAGVANPILDDKRDPAAFSLLVAVEWQHHHSASLGILNRVAEDLADRLRAIKGTEMVRLYGAPDEELTVEVDHRELAALRLSAKDLAGKIAESDSKRPAGTLRSSRSDLLLEVRGEIDSIARVESLPITHADQSTLIRVGDLANVERSWQEPPTEIATVDGRRSVIVAARVGRERPVDSWASDAARIVEDMRSSIGDGVAVDVIFDQAGYTRDRFVELGSNLLIGMSIICVVIFLLMGWRLGLVVASALPIVICLTTFGLFTIGEALHQMTVYGIVIALGLLVDNAIVVSDEVQRRKAAGLDREQAVSQSVRHLFLPLLASTTTTVLAFFPLIVLPGGPGDFAGAIGKSVAISVAISFLTAITITAALAGMFAKPTVGAERSSFLKDGLRSARLTTAFRRLLRQGLMSPVALIGLALFLPLTGFALAPSLGNSFFFPADRDMFEVRLWMPNDSGIHNTAGYARQLEKVIRQHPEVTRVYWLVGNSFPRVYYNLPMENDNSPFFAQAIVCTKSNSATKRVIAGLQERLEQGFPAAQVLVKQFKQGPPQIADVEYRVYGPSVEGMIDVGERIRRTLQADSEVVVAQATMTRGDPKIWFDAKEDEARLASLSLNEIAGQLRSSLDGSVGGTMVEDLEALPVRVRFVDEHRSTLSAIASTNFVSAEVDEWVPLNALGSVTVRPELTATTRYGGVRTNIIKGYTTVEALPINVAERVLATLEEEEYELPSGFSIQLGGTVEQENDTRADLLAPLPLLAVFMAATLILTFRSVAAAAILGVVAVMSVGMAILSTWAIDLPISFNTFMGTFGLIGIALNDSIVVMAAIRSNPEAAAGTIDGLVEAVVGSTRHVISTTLTTVGGFMPLIFIVRGDFWPSMSVVIAGGITGATIMALLFVPAAYRLLRPLAGVRRSSRT